MRFCMATPLADTTSYMTRFLSGASLQSLGLVDQEHRNLVQERYGDCMEIPAITDAYLSQERPLVFEERARSLACKVEALVGGRNLVDEGVSIYYPGAQLEMATKRLNCKVIGLIPLLQQIPAARACLKQVAQSISDKDKYECMKTWIQAHPVEVDRLSEIELIQYTADKVKQFVQPIFYPVGAKVYNLIPREIKYFTGLRKMTLDNNYIAGFPEEFSELHLEHLSVQMNPLKKLPPPIPTLKTLHLERNLGQFKKEDIEAFIRGYAQNGGQWIAIFLDPEHLDDYATLANEMEPRMSWRSH